MRVWVFGLLINIAAAFCLHAQSYETIFRTGTLDAVNPGTELMYSKNSQPLKLEINAEGKAVLYEARNDTWRRVAEFDAKVGNPMAMYFLESLVRELARQTGGSPYYIRNRLKESLVAENMIASQALETGETATIVTMLPFENDPNRAKMGPFADTEVTVTVSEEIPGYYVALRATTPQPVADGAAFDYSILAETE